jgi:uncharacterized membrane protein
MAKGKKAAPGKSASEYAKEAIAEWHKAASLGVAALSTAAASKKKPPLTLGMGSRLIERLRPDAMPWTSGRNGDGQLSQLPVPVQEAIEIAVPVRVVYALATRFESYPEFLDRVEAAEAADDSTISFKLRLRGRTRKVEVELTGERPEERIEWRSTEGPPSVGTISFHQLAPSLTHVELSVELEPEGIVERVTRATHLTERSIRAELHRFKAYAELWQDEEEIAVGSADDAEDEEPEAYEGDEFEDEFEDEPSGEAYVDETGEDDHHEAYEEVAR